MTNRKKKEIVNNGPAKVMLYDFDTKAKQFSLYFGRFIHDGGEVYIDEVIRYISDTIQATLPELDKKNVLYGMDARKNIATGLSVLLDAIIEMDRIMEKENRNA